MAYESIKVDIIPGAENAEVLHFSQYDNKRPFFIELFNGGAEFIPESGMSLTLECRKRDGNIVIISDPVLTDNVAEFSTTEQLTACYGDNTAEIKIVDDNDLVIGSANFIINVEKSPTCGGLVSESEIDNLEQQIAAIVPEVIGDDYYNKSETDALLADKADNSDLATLASKAELTQAILDEDRALKNWVSSNFATTGYVASRYYNKTQVDELIDNIFPTLMTSGPIASFSTALNKPLVSVTADPGATTITRCGKNLFDKTTTIDDNWINSSNSSVYFPGGFYSALIPVKPDTAYYLSNVIGGNDFVSSVHFDSDMNVIGAKNVSGSSIQSGSITTFNNSAYMRINSNMANKDTVMVSEGLTASAYEAYSGETVPVADATTLTTLSGVNYVFADSGDVTVQYKYMSM